MKIAAIYDTNTPMTTGAYLKKAFEELGYIVDAYHQDNVGSVPDVYEFYFVCDSGPTYKIPDWQSGPSIYYGIDTHLQFDTRLEMAKTADIPVMAQYTCGAKKAVDLGEDVLWMPLGCDPQIHRDLNVERDLDIAFVGHLYEDDSWRTTIKQKLLDHGLSEDKIFVGEAQHTDMANIYSRAKIVLNHTVRDNKLDINMRVYEAMSCGAFLITQKLDHEDMDILFSKELYAEYTDDISMFTIIDKVLSDYETYREIAQEAKLFVREHHTYAKHLKMLLKKLQED